MSDIRIPLRARDGSVRAWAVVSPEDADLANKKWSLGAGGYAVRSQYVPGGPQLNFRLHRVVLERMGHGGAPMCDHINRDRLDSRRENLRPADAKLNAANREYPNGRKGQPRTLSDPEPRPCQHCSATFTPRRKSPGRKFCSPTCQRAACLTHDAETQSARGRKRQGVT